MPELPELEVVSRVLLRHIVGETINQVEVFPPGAPVVIRDLTHNGFGTGLTGSRITEVARRGKFLFFTLQKEQPLYLVLNPKLTGRLQLSAPADKRLKKTHVVITFSNGRQLRYLDQRVMGQLYLTPDLNLVPDYTGMGPEPLDISPDEFRSRLKPFRGEIKGVLTRGQFVAGIGNAYADEILWAAHIYPFRKRTQLSSDEIGQLYEAMRRTLLEAIDQVAAEMGEHIERKPRDFLAVHMKSGAPCPRCQTPVSVINTNQRITNFCRTCQPGGLIKGM